MLDARAELREKGQEVVTLHSQLGEVQRSIQIVTDQLNERERALHDASAQLDEKERKMQALDLQLDTFMNSTGWALLQLLWRIRLSLAPRGSQREEWMQRLLRGSKPVANQLIVSTIPIMKAKSTEPAQPGPVDATTSGWNKRLLGSIRGRTPYQLRQTIKHVLPRTFYASATLPPVETTQGSDIHFVRSHTQKSWFAYNRPSVYDILVFPIIDWDFRYQRPQQLAARFARLGHRVFYFSTKFQDCEDPTIRVIQENILEITLTGPDSLNIYLDSVEKPVAEKISGNLISLFEDFSVKEAVCFVDLPFWSPIAIALREKFGWKVIYDCMDWHSGFSTNSKKMLEEEKNFSRQSDLILATSHSLYAHHVLLNPNCALVPNAVDFDQFHLAPDVRPQELENIRGPIIGYYGAISDWFDSHLIRFLAKQKPDWSFVLIGRTFGADLTPLDGLRNVHHIDEKPYSSLPAYLHQFDVCMIPFKKTPLTEATNPVKLFEYLSAGKSVVATDLDELRYYSGYIRLASTSQEWLDAIEEILNQPKPEHKQISIDFARRNTWNHRVSEIRTHIERLYPKASIVIVTFNNMDCNRICLESIFSRTLYPNFEVIVVDNASTDGTLEFLKHFAKTQPQVTVISNSENRGFAAANNQGVAAATGEYIVFLNNDTAVTRGWLSRLIYHLRNPEVGMVGPVTNWSGNESRIEAKYESLDQLESFAESYTNEKLGRIFEIKMLALFCVAMRRDVFEEIGELDESFGIGMFEDDDYAFRVKQKGYKIICAEDVFIHHWGRASFSKLREEEYRGLFEDNRRKFEEKWKIKWQPHQYRTW